MLLESFGFGLDALTLQVIFGLVIGLVFGIAAQVSRFCLRRTIAGQNEERGPAAAVWLIALATAITGFLVADILGFVALDGHRYLDLDLPYLAIIVGGLAFGAGMILTRGCVSRLTVLSATGNMRAVTVLMIFAFVAHATIKGVFAPLRTALGAVTVPLPFGSFASLPLGAPIAAALVIAAALYLVNRYRPKLRDGIACVLIGLTAVVGWSVTSVLLFDEFDPLTVQSVAFTLPWTDTLFWFIASTSIPAGFGTGLIGGVLLGSFGSGLLRGGLKLEGFDGPQQFVRYALGAALMGVGGVLAGGCTVGAGLSGSATLSVAALLALVSIVAGGVLASRVTTRVGVPALA